jgi:hypothetical protein
MLFCGNEEMMCCSQKINGCLTTTDEELVISHYKSRHLGSLFYWVAVPATNISSKLMWPYPEWYTHINLHFLLVHTWIIRSLWIYSLYLSWFFSQLFNPTSYNPNSHFQITHPTTNTSRWNHDSNNMVLQFLTSQKAFTNERQFPWRPKFARFILSTHKW